jgi:hypothetical protein
MHNDVNINEQCEEDRRISIAAVKRSAKLGEANRVANWDQAFRSRRFHLTALRRSSVASVHHTISFMTFIQT